MGQAKFLFEISQYESESQMPRRGKNIIHVAAVGEKGKQQLFNIINRYIGKTNINM